MGNSLSAHAILSKKYKYFEIEGKWRESVGLLARPFSMLVFGRPKNGKTSFIMSLCKYLTSFGKVYYNSAEEGDSKTIQDSLILCKMDEVPSHLFTLGDRDTFDEMVVKLKYNRAVFVVIDSIDYIYMTKLQYQNLRELFPNKSFIIISWEKNGKPKTQVAKDIEHMVGSIVHVKNFTAYVQGRYGGNEPYVIWDRGKKKVEPKPEQLSLPLGDEKEEEDGE